MVLASSTFTAHANTRTKRFAESYDADQAPPDSPVPSRPVDYADMRFAVLNLIAGASRNVWLVSEFFSDSEIVSSLFMAQFRKLDVQVVVGASRAADPLSRVTFLMKQRIPTFLRPKTWNVPYDSALLTDEQLVWISGSFDPYSSRREYRMVLGSDEEKRTFEQSFGIAIGQKNLPPIRSMPQVGRPSNRYSNQTTSYSRPAARQETRSDEPTVIPDVYNYNRAKPDRNAPSGVTTRLPKQTISQKREAERAKPEPEPATEVESVPKEE